MPQYRELRAQLALLPTHPEFLMRQLAINNELYVKFCQLSFHIGIYHELRRKLCFYAPYWTPALLYQFFVFIKQIYNN